MIGADEDEGRGRKRGREVFVGGGGREVEGEWSSDQEDAMFRWPLSWTLAVEDDEMQKIVQDVMVDINPQNIQPPPPTTSAQSQ